MAAAPHTESFVAYNKAEDGVVPTLVGNWVEERHLASRTGVHRLPTDPACASGADVEPAQSVYPKHTSNAGKLLHTLPRTLEHDAQYLAAEWLPTSTVVYQPPQQRVGDLLTYCRDGDLGPRGAAEEAALLAEARRRVAAPPRRPPCFDTTYRSDFVQQTLCANTLGKVQMRDPDGRPAYRDANFLAETRTVPRELADRRVAARGSLAPQQRTAAPQGGEAVTIYSEAAAKGTYAGGFYGTKQHGATTFGKYANFSKVIGDCTKDPLATCE